MSEKIIWYREHVEGIGWSEFKTYQKQEKEQEQIVIVGQRYGFSEEQKLAIYETFNQLAHNINEILGPVFKLLQSAMQSLGKWYLDNVDTLFAIQEERKIYKAEYRIKSTVKKYGYTPNYRNRMFCVGGYGNFRRF